MFQNQRKQFDWLEKFDWEMFWIRQALFLAVPLLIAVFTLHHETSISLHRLEIVLIVQLSLTVLNVAWSLFRARASSFDWRPTRKPVMTAHQNVQTRV